MSGLVTTLLVSPGIAVSANAERVCITATNTDTVLFRYAKAPDAVDAVGIVRQIT
jgi:hypothetical protein